MVNKIIFQVNFASRMQSSCPPNQIQMSEPTALKIINSPRYRLTKRGVVKVKGKGEVNTYWLDLAEGQQIQSTHRKKARKEAAEREKAAEKEKETTPSPPEDPKPSENGAGSPVIDKSEKIIDENGKPVQEKTQLIEQVDETKDKIIDENKNEKVVDEVETSNDDRSTIRIDDILEEKKGEMEKMESWKENVIPPMNNGQLV